MSPNNPEGARVLLRPIALEDTPLIVKWRSLPSVYMNLYSRRPTLPSEHEAWMRGYVLTGKCAQFIIVEKETQTPVGSVFIKNIDRSAQKGEYGIFIGEESARGKGLGSEAARLMLQYGFEALGLHRIYLSVFAYNQAAIQSYKRAGFRTEGVFRDDFLYDGRYEDIVWMAAIREEWERLTWETEQAQPDPCVPV